MEYEKIELERAGAVATVRLNDPALLNTLTAQMIEELDHALDAISGSARAMVLTGAGRGFCSGAGLNGGLNSVSEADGPDYGAPLESHLHPLMSKLRNLSIPWIAAVRGPAAGGGCSLALAADMVIASETAYFLQSFARIGLVPDSGSTHLLPRGATRVRAMEMMLLGDRISAETALEWGLINRLVPDTELDDAAAALARRLADGPTRTLGTIRKIAWEALDSDWPTALAAERQAQRLVGRTRDAREGIKAFLEKRPAAFEGR